MARLAGETLVVAGDLQKVAVRVGHIKVVVWTVHVDVHDFRNLPDPEFPDSLMLAF